MKLIILLLIFLTTSINVYSYGRKEIGLNGTGWYKAPQGYFITKIRNQDIYGELATNAFYYKYNNELITYTPNSYLYFTKDNKSWKKCKSGYALTGFYFLENNDKITDGELKKIRCSKIKSRNDISLNITTLYHKFYLIKGPGARSCPYGLFITGLYYDGTLSSSPITKIRCSAVKNTDY